MFNKTKNKEIEKSVEEIREVLAKQEKDLLAAGWEKIDTGVSTIYTHPSSPRIYETLSQIKARANSE